MRTTLLSLLTCHVVATAEQAGNGFAAAVIEPIAEGFQFTEGPVWMPDESLLFSDIPANRIYRWTPETGHAVWREPSGQSNGLCLDRQNRLIACEHANRRVSRTEADGTVVTLADRYEGKRLNSPNDAAIAPDGGIYFTDPPYGVEAGLRELDFQGVYRIPPDGGPLQLLLADFDRPNGLVFSPDYHKLYIADSARRHVRAFDVQADGSLANGRLFIETGGGSQVPDGMTVDRAGNLYVPAEGGLWVVNATGEHIHTFAFPQFVSNCTFGEADRKSLFVTATSTVYRIRLPIGGVSEESALISY